MTEPVLPDTPGVVVRPPLLYAGTFLAILVLRALRPLPLLAHGGGLWPGLLLMERPSASGGEATLACDTASGLLLFVPVALVMHHGVILREERYLEGKFGETCRGYRARVGRYV